MGILKSTFQIVVIMFFSLNLFAQNEIDNDLNQLKEAYVNVQLGNYKAALPYFKNMLQLYPKDPTYNYYYGRCLLFEDKSYKESIKYLKFASVRNVPADVYFYLGFAYLKIYQFEDAAANFRWFEKSASRKEMRELGLSNYISMAENGLYLIKYFKKPQVYSKKVASIFDFYSSYDLKGVEGRFYDRYRYLNNAKDSMDQQSLIFVPNYLEKNEVLYFSAKNEKRGDYDIYRITRLNDNSWSEPENLGDIINTPFDENYPFIHTDGTTLYFASEGHYSMGGYDLYKSIWNWETQKWAEPENLDFPINSPFNDVLYVPSPDNETACFASDREIVEGKFSIYKIQIGKDQPYIEYLNTEQIVDLAKLDVNVIEQKKPVAETLKTEKSKTNSIVKVANETDFLYKSEYDSLVNLAVNFQIKTDSLRWVIDDKRSLYEQITDESKRTVMANEIIDIESRIYTLQKKADNCYRRVREIEQENLAKNKLTYKEKQEEKIPEKITQKEKIKEDKSNVVIEPKDNSLNRSKLEVLDREDDPNSSIEWGLKVKLPSIYNVNNPIKINGELPNGIVYMIQLGAFSTPKSPSVFKGMQPLTCIKKENSNIHKYYAGIFNKLDDAEKKISLVKSKGFKDAYVVAFNNRIIIPVSSAQEMESKENKPVIESHNKEKEIDTDNLGIIYVIQGEISLGDSAKVDTIRKSLNENLDLFIKKNSSTIKFIINSFTKYNDAFLIKSKLEGILQKEFEIHAYFAENQIPLDQARKITK